MSQLVEFENASEETNTRIASLRKRAQTQLQTLDQSKAMSLNRSLEAIREPASLSQSLSYQLRLSSNRSVEKTKVSKYRYSSMAERLGSKFIAKIRESIRESDMLDELAKKQPVGWASISQLSILHQKQALASLMVKGDTNFLTAYRKLPQIEPKS